MKVPSQWIAEQERMAKIPGFLEAGLSSLRAQLNLFGQHQIILDLLPQLKMPTLIMWGINDLVLPNNQAQNAVSRLKQGHLALIPNCGHIPQVECPELFTTELNKFLVLVNESMNLSHAEAQRLRE